MRKVEFLKTVGFVIVMILIFAGCSSGPAASEEDGRLAVLATTTIIADVVSNVAGPELQVQALLPAGSDPHRFDASPNEARAIADADVVFMNGAGLDRFILDLVPAGPDGPVVIDLSEGIRLIEFSEGDHPEEEEAGEHVGDPHVWTDPANVVEWVGQIEATLSGLDPDNASLYAENAAGYIRELEALDAWIAKETANIPPEKRLLVTDHDSLGYFVDKYGFTVLGFVVPGLSTLAQPSAQEMAALIDIIRAAGVPVIFVDPSFNPALAESVANDAGVEVVRIYTGSLSLPDGPASTYLDMMRRMTEAFRDNLGGID